MIITISTITGATYVRLFKGYIVGKVVKTVEQGEYYIDYDKDGNIVGIEYLNLPSIITTEE